MKSTHIKLMVRSVLALGVLAAAATGCAQDQTPAPPLQTSAAAGGPPVDTRPSVGMPIDPRAGSADQYGTPPGSPGGPKVGPGIPGGVPLGPPPGQNRN